MGASFRSKGANAARQGTKTRLASTRAGKLFDIEGGTAPSEGRPIGSTFGEKVQNIATDAIYEGSAKPNNNNNSLSAIGKPVPAASTTTASPVPYSAPSQSPSPMFKTDDNGNESLKTFSDYLSEAING